MTPPTGSHATPGDLELLRDWLPLVRRLRLAAVTGGGQKCAVLSVQIVLDAEGVPRHWTVPERTPIEPRDGSDQLLKLVDALTRAGSRADGKQQRRGTGDAAGPEG